MDGNEVMPADLSEELSERLKAEYERLCEEFGVRGLKNLDLASRNARSGYNRALKAGDEAAAAKYLSIATGAADKMALRLEKLHDRRDRRDAVGELSGQVRPVIEMVPVGEDE